jgi:hypothetical protein
VHGIDRQHDRHVALKVRHVGSVDERNQVLAEARVLLSLRPHPGLPVVREDFFEGDNYVLVMDWIDGTSLDQVVAARGAPGMPLPSVLRWAAQLGAAIDHLHAHRPVIVHGDIKPANAVLTPDDRVVLVDFGIATSGGGVSAGTVGYTAPEVLDGQAPSPSADIYGLAATILALLTGRPPGDVRPPWDGVDPTTVQVIERALRAGLALEPKRRPGSARELVERMHAWAGMNDDAATPVTTADKHRAISPRQRATARKRQVPLPFRFAGGAALVGAIVVGLVLSSGNGDAATRRIEGQTRYSTAAQVALETFDRADFAVLARGDDLADAVAASYLAGSHGGGPLLLTQPQALPPDVLHALQHLKVKQVFVIGDATAVGDDVDAELQKHGIRTTRIAGVNRYATAATIGQTGGLPEALAGFGPTALLVNDADVADAVAAAPISFHSRFTLFYTEADSVPEETVAALQEAGVKHVLLVGTTNQISADVAAQLAGLGMTAQRIAGAGDPASGSVALASFEQKSLKWPLEQVDLVRGDQGAVDGVATIAHAGARTAALLLTDAPDTLAVPLKRYLAEQAGRVRTLVVVGDLSTISADVEQDAAATLRLSN